MFFIDDVQENHEQTKNCAALFYRRSFCFSLIVSVASKTSQFLHHLRSFAREKKVAKACELNLNDFPWLLRTRFVQMDTKPSTAINILLPYREEKYGSH